LPAAALFPLRQWIPEAENIHHHITPRRPGDPPVIRLDTPERHEIDRQLVAMTKPMLP